MNGVLEKLSPTISSAVSHIGKLSDEVLSEIFLHCCRQSPSEPLLSTEAPLNVSGVSLRWRRIALSSPRLWSCINLRTSDHPDDTNSAHFVKSVECCKMWLRRSGVVPLRLRIAAFSYIKPTNLLMLDLFRQQKHRLVEAYLCLNYGHLIRESDMRVLSLTSLPNLERLTVSYMPTLRDRAMTIDLSYLRLLRELVLLGNVHIAPVKSSLPELRRFTYAKVNEVSPFAAPALVDSLRMINKSPNLEEIYLQGAYVHDGIAYDMPVICAGSLRKISLFLDRPVLNGRVSILDQLTLPALEDAEFNFQRTTVRGPLPGGHSILSLFQRSRPSIKRLSVGGGCIDDTDLLGILRISPSLRCLELMCHVFVDLHSFLDKMTFRPEFAHNLCPDLETLVFYACPWGASGRGMADMIISRCMDYDSDGGHDTLIGKLRRVYLYRMGYLELSEDEAVQECVHEGLNLNVVA